MRTNRLQVDTDNGVSRFYRELTQLLADWLYQSLGQEVCWDVIDNPRPSSHFEPTPTEVNEANERVNQYNRHTRRDTPQDTTVHRQVILTDDSDDDTMAEPIVTIPAQHTSNPADLEKFTRDLLRIRLQA